MTQKWNLEDIKPRGPRPTRSPEADIVVTEPKPAPAREREVSRESTSRTTVGSTTTKRRRHTVFYGFCIFVAIVLGTFAVSQLLSGTELTVNPRFREPNVNATVTALRSPQPGELPFELLTLEATGERQVTATGQENAVEQAVGTVLVYNRHSTEPVRLITNTRFETSDKKLFRLKESIVVPGYTRAEDGSIAPGVANAEVFADQPGEDYNIGPSTFTIPGFAGSPEFENVTAESIESMRGGFNGQRFIIDQAELETAQQGLQAELRNSLLARIEAEKPAGFTLFPDAVTFTYESLPAVEYGENLATIKEKAVLRVPLFEDAVFAEYIAAATIPGYEHVPVKIEDTSTLAFAYTSATTSSSNIAAVDRLEFTLVGRPLVVWTYDAEALKRDLAGKNKTALTTVLGGYPAIESADAKNQPVWSNSFPDDPADITVIEVLERQSE